MELEPEGAVPNRLFQLYRLLSFLVRFRLQFAVHLLATVQKSVTAVLAWSWSRLGGSSPKGALINLDRSSGSEVHSRRCRGLS